MECFNCGATLRPGAHFCTQCGTRQDAIDLLPTATPARRKPEPETEPAPGADAGQGVGLPTASPSGRMPRPARIPRSTDAATPRAPQSPDVAPAGHAREIADAETMEYPSRKGGVRTVPLPARAGMAESESAPADGLPWPLPPNIIVDGRYRVESLISTGPVERGAENVYLVSDLQGYERCWSCHAKQGPEAATRTLCAKCGADMLDRDYVLRERLLPPAEAETEVSRILAEAEAATSTPGERFFTQGQRAYRVSPRPDDTPRFPQGVHVVAGLASDRGRGRPDEPNQDSQGLLIFESTADSRCEPLVLAIVADGLGGHASGLEASQLAVRTFSDSLLRAVVAPWLAGDRRRLNGDGLERALRTAIQDANTALCRMNESQGTDAGSTVVAVVVAGETAYLVNVGDSRAYVLGREGLRRITTDHSLVEQLVANGTITEDERYDHPQRNQILRSLGEVGTEMDFFTLKLRPGMRLLLCSDGLWEMVRYDEMAHILSDTRHPQAVCAALVRAANDHGGDDNISALVIETHT
jgi:serine/threonine protein phosphatase PrpC